MMIFMTTIPSHTLFPAGYRFIRTNHFMSAFAAGPLDDTCAEQLGTMVILLVEPPTYSREVCSKNYSSLWFQACRKEVAVISFNISCSKLNQVSVYPI